MQKFSRAPKALDMYKIISDKDNLISYLMENKLLDNQMKCTTCDSDMQIIKRKDISDSKQWRCVNCLKTCSIRKNSIFEVSC